MPEYIYVIRQTVITNPHAVSIRMYPLKRETPKYFFLAGNGIDLFSQTLAWAPQRIAKDLDSFGQPFRTFEEAIKEYRKIHFAEAHKISWDIQQQLLAYFRSHSARDVQQAVLQSSIQDVRQQHEYYLELTLGVSGRIAELVDSMIAHVDDFPWPDTFENRSVKIAELQQQITNIMGTPADFEDVPEQYLERYAQTSPPEMLKQIVALEAELEQVKAAARAAFDWSQADLATQEGSFEHFAENVVPMLEDAIS